jgi:CHAT domain-containing protein/predicted LPLAT superfamily acyltransferase
MSNNVDPELLKRLMSVRSEQELMQLLAEHPELMPVLEQMMEEQTVMMKAIDAFVNAETWAESKQVVEANPELLSDEADALLAQLIEAQEDERAVHILEEHRQLLARCRVEGIDAAFGDQVWDRDVVPEDVDAELLKRLMSVRSEQEMLELLAEHPELMPMLEQMMGQVEPGHHVRAENLEVTYIATASGSVEVPDRFREQVARQQSLPNTPEGIEQEIAIRENILRVLPRHEAPAFWGVMQDCLGAAYRHRVLGDRADNIERAIAALQAALEVRTRDEFPVDWADTQDNLGLAYCQRIRGDRAENLEHAIVAFESAVEIRERADYWADAQINLGDTYRDRIRGNRADNLEQAIAAYTAALEVYTRDGFPVQWAMIHNNLGSVYCDRIRGNRAENLEQAIAAFQAALEVCTRTNFPVQWAMVQYNLGAAYRAENIEQAIAAFQAALEVYTRDDSPAKWAMAKSNLGMAFRDRIHGDRAENLEQAIAAYAAALEVYTRTDFPVQWANIQNNLGNAYCRRIRGNRAENLEKAITAYKASMEIHTQDDFPLKWATTRDNLAVALQEYVQDNQDEDPKTVPEILGQRQKIFDAGQAPSQFVQPGMNPYREAQSLRLIEQALAMVDRQQSPELWAELQSDLALYLSLVSVGDRAENLEQAIDSCTAALEVYRRDDFPVQWAATQNNLGIAYSKRIRGNRAENLEQAIAAFQAALEVFTQTDFAVGWAMVQNNLGEAYRQRIRGSQADNLEQAIVSFQAALEVRTRADFPVDWAVTQNNLGIAYSKRIWGDRSNNLEQAIAAFQASLDVCTQTDFPVQWAVTQNNLGVVLSERIRGDRAENLERAIVAFQNALKVRTKADLPVDWATTHSNLGSVYCNRILGDREDNLEQAIVSFQAALEVRTRIDFPVQWAATQDNLGGAYFRRIRGNRAENLERAITAFQAALEVYAQDDFPIDWVMVQSNLGAAYTERVRGDRAKNIEQAITAYQLAIEGAQAVGIKDYEARAAGTLGNIYYDQSRWSLAYAALNTAITALEAMRAQYVTEEAKTHLVEENARLYTRMTDVCLRLGHPKEALERAEAGKGRIFLDQLGTDNFPAPLVPQGQQPLLRGEREVLNELRSLEYAIRNALDEEQRRQFAAQLEERRSVLDEVWTRLEPYAPDYVAVRRGDPVKYGYLQALVDGFGTAAALVEFYTLPDKIIVFVLRSGEKEPAVTQVPMSQVQLLRHVQIYWREVVEYSQRGDIGQRWQELAEPLLADVLPYLQGAELVYLVPHGLLHYLPLHALQVDGEYLIDHFPIAYTPSAAVLARVIQRTAEMERTGNGRGALVLGYTSHERERAVFEGEAVQVAEFFGTEPHLGQEATGALLREKGAQYDTLHLSCHGFFDPTDPLASGLQLADGVLTARDIMGLKLNADLVTLSACQTALSEHQPGDELVGLTRALLYAGASSVLVTLWSVDAVAALELMGDFYSRLRGRGGAKVEAEAVALREAMLEMRKERGHPYYWAPFILVGDWQ